MSRLRCVAAMSLVVASSACAGGAATTGRHVADAEGMRSLLNGKDAQSLAPEAFAAANEELVRAKQEKATGDETGADLHADRAVALFNQAIVLARIARATREEAEATAALARATEQTRRYSEQRKAIDKETDDLEKKLRVAREAQRPAASGPADPERERARVVAAQSLATEARLLCSAARLVMAQAPGLRDAETALATLDTQIDRSKAAAMIDPAARVRAACLTSLTKARRATGVDTDLSDTLLSELSQSGAPSAAGNTSPRDLAPARDERGVVVTIRGGFNGDALTAEAEASLKNLGLVAAAHPNFAVQIVLHDSAAPSASETLANQKRGEAAVRALVDGGAARTRVKVEQVGAKAPVVDPRDARHRDRNARLEVVFVSGGS